MIKREIKAISFDFWNTLFRDLHGDAYQATRLKMFVDLLKPYQDSSEELIIEAFRYCSESCYQIWVDEQRTPTALERVEIILDCLKLTLPQTIIDHLALKCGEMVLHFPPVLVENSREVLEQLAQEYKLAIISDTGFAPGSVLREILRRNEIIQYFNVLTFSDEAQHSKPHAKIFKLTAKNLGIKTSEMLHIGDLEFTDVAGANGVGAISVLFAADHPASSDSKAHFIVKSHLELIDILTKFR